MKYIIKDQSFNQDRNTIEIKKGETVFLVGPNTTGKSTLLESLQFSWYKKTLLSAHVEILLDKNTLEKALEEVVRKEHKNIIIELLNDFKERKIILPSKSEEIDTKDNDFIRAYLETISKTTIKNEKESLSIIKQEMKELETNFSRIMTIVIKEVKAEREEDFKKINIKDFLGEDDKEYRYRKDAVKNPIYNNNKKINKLKIFKIRIEKRFDDFKPSEMMYFQHRLLNFEDEISGMDETDIKKEIKDGLKKIIDKRNILIERIGKIKIYYFNEYHVSRVLTSIKHINQIGFYLMNEDIYNKVTKIKHIREDIASEVEKTLDIQLVWDKEKSDYEPTHAIDKHGQEIFRLSNGQIKQIENIKNNFKNANTNLSWDEPFTSLDYNNTRIQRDGIINNGKTNLISTHKFSSIFPVDTANVYVIFQQDKEGKRNIVKLSEYLTYDDLPAPLKKITTKLFSELFSARKRNLVVEGRDDMLMVEKLYEISGMENNINFIILNGVSKLKVFLDLYNYMSDFLGTKTRLLLDNDQAAINARKGVRSYQGIDKLTQNIYDKYPEADSFDKIFVDPEGDKIQAIKTFLKKDKYSPKEIEKAKVVCNIIEESFKTKTD